MAAACSACGSSDLDLEESPPFCNECGEEVEEHTAEVQERLVVVGLVIGSAAVPNKDKLTRLKVDVGGGKEVTVVTNARYCEVGKRLVVALPGASLAGLEGPVARATVGGVKSEGMVCDSAMLSWSGGAAGQAVFLPESYLPGDSPPETRPKPAA